MHVFLHAFLHALKESALVFPFLLIIYILIELLERKSDLSFRSRLRGRLGPLIGSATGLIPQCGFSVMAAKLYEQRYITIGTLLAIFFATSDEAFIIILSSGSGAKYLLPMLIVKLFIGIFVGYSVDLFLRLVGKNTPLRSMQEESTVKRTKDLFFEREGIRTTYGCTSCGREHDEGKPFKTYLLSPFLHSLQVWFFIFLVNFAFGWIVEGVSPDKISKFMQKSEWAQPILTALVGLIPNCASSVVLTGSFLEGGIAFGSCIAGLCVNAGLGFVVLLKNRKKVKRNLCLIVFCYTLSVAIGYLINGIMAF